MDESFTLRRSDSDTLVFQDSSETAHCMTFEMSEINEEVIIGKMAAYTVEFKIFGV